MDLEDIADELYALVPADFVAARDARVGAARTAGDRHLAVAVKNLRKPTTSAWLANLLALERSDRLDQVLGLGDALRAAQASGSGDDLRRLGQQRHQVVAALAHDAAQLARDHGSDVHETAVHELEATLHAALADPECAQRVRSGRLTTSIVYSGFGGDLDGAPQPVSPDDLPAHSHLKGADDHDNQESERQVAEERTREQQRRVRQAELEAGDADRADDDAVRHLVEVVEDRDGVRRRVADLEAQLALARAAQDMADRGVSEAEQARAAAHERAAEGRRRVDAARAELDRLAPGPEDEIVRVREGKG